MPSKILIPAKPDNPNNTSYYYPFISVITFTALLFTSVILYTGGSPFEPLSHKYSFTQNFLSDLGREVTFRKQDNSPSRIFFSLSLAVIASGFAVLSVNSKKFHALRGKGKFAGTAAATSGIISSVFLISAGVTPWDTMFWAHVWSVNIAFLFIFLYVLFLAYAQLISGISKKYYLFNLFVAICITAQLLLLIFGPYYRTPEGLPVQVTAQKIVVVVFLANLLLQAYGIRK